MEFQAVNAQIGAVTFFVFLMQGIGFVLVFWAVYWVTKKAIKDAIAESGLLDEIRKLRLPATKEKTSQEIARDDFSASR